MKSYYKNYVDGQWIDGGSGVISVDNPATGEHLADQACASSKDIDLAVKAAKRVHEANLLSAMRPVDRGRMVKKMGKFLEENASAIAEELTLEAGKPLWEAEIEVRGAARYFEYYGNQAETIEGKSIPLGENLTTLPKIPVVVTISSPVLRASSIVLCSFACFICGRVSIK